MEEGKKITDLSDKELLENYEQIDSRIDAEYKILGSLKTTKNEHLNEILRRFGGKIDGISKESNMR